MAHFRAIGFDVGETLVTYADAPLNWVSLYRPALERAAAAVSVTPTESQFSAAENVLKSHNTRLHPRTQEVTAETIFQELLEAWSIRDGAKLAPSINAFFRFFQQSLRCYQDTRPALQQLRERGVLLGALTDVPYGMPRSFVDSDLSTTGVASLIDQLLTSVDVGFRKLAPNGFYCLADRLGVAPSEMMYVGNEPKDIQGAKAAGMMAVLIDRDNAAPAYGQDAILRSLEELTAFL